MTLLDAHVSAPAEPADLCIVGAGAAGITIAREFIDTSWRVLVIESGGLEVSARMQRLNAGHNVGLPSYALAYSRFRVFGGSTSRWTSQCRPLDPIDFEARPSIEHSGWPIDHRHLARWYGRAETVCGLAVVDESAWAPDPATPLFDDDELEPIRFRFGHPHHFGEMYRGELARATNVEVVLNASVVEIEPEADLRAVRAVHAKTLGGRRFSARARAYVLACGGIENPRLLLASNRIAAAGLGNQHDLVGRFFMDHPYLTTGYFVPAAPHHAAGPHVIRSFKQAGVHQTSHAGFALRQRIRRDERLTGGSVYFIRRLASETAPEHFSRGGKARLRIVEFLDHRTATGADLGRHLRHMTRGYRDVALTLGRRLVEVVRPRHVLALRTILETTPRADSRVTLAGARDPLGMPMVRVDWRINDGDRRGLDRLRQALAAAIERRGLGFLVDHAEVDDTGWPISTEGGKHHMGTTRMDADPKRGVVDPDARVHGIGNLYVAGSSVFPTSGYANPTFTIVALALRLADHLKHRLGNGL